MAKYYFRDDDDEYCYPLKVIKRNMADEGINELKVFEAQRILKTGMFFCKEFMEVGETGESCGNRCFRYIPNNGKNGRCKHYGFLYEPTKNVKILKI